jgi:iron(III) transport system permease protein
MAFVQGLLIVPLSFIMLAASFSTMDPAHEEAGMMSGARPVQVFRRISLTIVTPAIAAVAIYQFVVVVQAFDIPAVLGLSANVRVLSTLIFGALQPAVGLPDYGAASVYSLLLLALAILPLFWYYRLLAQANRYATVTGKGYRPRRLHLGRWRYPALAAVLLYLFVAFVLPVFVMLWTSLQPYFAPPSAEAFGRITFAAYQRLLTLPSLQQVILNTIVVAAVSASLVALLALLEAWVVIRMRSRMGVFIDFLAFATTAIPGIVIGVSLLFVYISVGNVIKPTLYGTVWVLVIGMVTVTIAISTRIMGVAVSQIHRDLEEAAELSGATPVRVLRHVVAPLLRPALANVWIVVLLAASTNLTISLVLNSSANRLLAVQLYSDWNFGEIASACALGVLLMAGTLTLSFLFRRTIVRSSEI